MIGGCEHDGCQYPAVARVTDASLPHPVGVGLGFAIVRPANAPGHAGRFLCADHTHLAVDLVLMRALPEVGR